MRLRGNGNLFLSLTAGAVVIVLFIFVFTQVSAPTIGVIPNTIPSPTPISQQLGSKPNIIIILTDDQWQDTMWAMPKTSAAIIDKGMSLDNYIIPTSACCPSRASLLTGLYAHDDGVYSNEPKYGSWEQYKAHGNQENSLPIWLHEAGYRTGLFGKYMNGYNIEKDGGVPPPGWDEWVTFTVLGGPSGAYYDYHLTDGTVHGSANSDYSTEVLSRRMNSFITQTPTNQPLFAYFAPYAPHAPQTPSDKYRSKSDTVTPRYPPGRNPKDVTDRPAWLQRVARYDERGAAKMDKNYRNAISTLASVDDAVSNTVTTLAETGRLDNTLIVYASDNGYMWGVHRLGHKMVPYDMATRVPAFIRWDGHFTPGSKNTNIVANVDITATIVQAAGLDARTDGMSLLESKVRTGTVLEIAPIGGRPSYCGYREKDWLFVRWATGEEELYNYAKDPYELRNVAYKPAYQNEAKRLRKLTRQACSPTPPKFTWVPRKTIVAYHGPTAPLGEDPNELPVGVAVLAKKLG